MQKGRVSHYIVVRYLTVMEMYICKIAHALRSKRFCGH
jgi:hypothetical protein